MKLNKHKVFSALFLFIFISAFSSGIYGSLSDSYKAFSHFSLHKEVKQDKAFASSEELIFDETENDSEDSVNPLLTLIPNFLNINFLVQDLNTFFTEFHFSAKATQPIFLYIRVLRI